MTTEPNTITFLPNINADWVMRITADRRIEVNEDVEATEAAQKVLEAMQWMLDGQKREWVGLTDEQIKGIRVACGNPLAIHFEFARAIEAKLKEKNT